MHFALQAQKVNSELWGKQGEFWDKNKIPDFTNAGYKNGKEPIPTYPTSINLKKLGAVGDGITDNTEVLRKAIQQCKEFGTIYIPEGNYLLSDTIVISRKNICIKGEGAAKTKLFFTKGLEELYPNYNTRFKNQSSWSWSGAMLLVKGNISGIGIEKLQIQFPDSLWNGHDFHERAYNAIGFDKGANNCWVRDVVLKGCDLGFWLSTTSTNITLENWVLDFSEKRAAQKVSGHHGTNIYGGYNLLQNFRIVGRFHHDLSVESTKSVFNVFRNGEGLDLCIDHHNHDQRNNLFTNLNAGLGNRLFFSGGNEKPNGICFNEVFWNITAKKNMPYCDQYDEAEKQSKNNICIGILTAKPSILNDANGNWFETIDPNLLYPKDLYKAQMELLKK